MSQSAKMIYFTAAAPPDLDSRIETLGQAWDEGEAVAIGQALTAERGAIEDYIRRNREEERRRDRENAFRLAYWTLAVMQQHGPAWYEWMTRTDATTLDQQTLYQYKSELLRVKPDLRHKHNVNAAVLRAAATLKSEEAQDNLLSVAAAIDAPAAAVREAARVMRDTGATDVPAFIHGYKRPALAGEPDLATELWLHFTEFARAVRSKLQELGMSQVEAYEFVRRHEEDAQRLFRGEEMTDQPVTLPIPAAWIRGANRLTLHVVTPNGGTVDIIRFRVVNGEVVLDYPKTEETSHAL